MSERLTERLLDYWREKEVTYRTGCAEEALLRWETHHAVKLPDDLREYFLTANGLEPGKGVGSEHFWSLETLRPLPDEFSTFPTTLREPESWFVFADVFMDMYFFAIRLDSTQSGSNPVICFLEDLWWAAAPSFTDFLRCYIETPEKIAEPFELMPAENSARP